MAVGKRKRETLPDEVEVDINAPEPPSKKELRRAKKGKPVNHKPANSDDEADPVAKAARKAISKNQATHRELDRVFDGIDAEASSTDEADDDDDDTAEDSAAPAKKTAETERPDAPSVWIGNLPWTVTKANLIKFVTDNGKVLPTDITRVHMPGPTTAAAAQARSRTLSNRGFAYMDFKTEEARDLVIALSEKLIGGRAVLIKNAKSYEGRPAKAATKDLDRNGKPPSQRIFVGNLAFDIVEDDLRDHFAKCGQVKSVFIATFPDSGNCKGYAWVTFEELVSAEKAIRGWVELQPEQQAEDEDEEMADAKDEDEEDPEKLKTVSQARKERRKKKPKPRKWFVNRLKGRELRMEYAEDATTRYQKRFAKKKDDTIPSAAADVTPPEDFVVGGDRSGSKSESNGHKQKIKPTQPPPPRPAKLEESKDKAYLTGAVMEGKGKKVKF